MAREQQQHVSGGTWEEKEYSIAGGKNIPFAGF